MSCFFWDLCSLIWRFFSSKVSWYFFKGEKFVQNFVGPNTKMIKAQWFLQQTAAKRVIWLTKSIWICWHSPSGNDFDTGGRRHLGHSATFCDRHQATYKESKDGVQLWCLFLLIGTAAKTALSLQKGTAFTQSLLWAQWKLESEPALQKKSYWFYYYYAFVWGSPII